MPFTLAHPAVVINVKSKKIDLTAIVLGAMSPDFLYFINFKPYGSLGHTFIGFLILNLPICFILAYIFHKYVKKSLIIHMPSPIDKWYSNFAISNWQLNDIKRVVKFTYSAVIGMITHVIWDGFTHESGLFVEHIKILVSSIKFYNYNIPIYKVLQHGSTIIGIIIIAIYIYNNKNINGSRLMVTKREKVTYWFFNGLLMIIFIFICYISSVLDLNNIAIGNVIITFMNCSLLAIISSSIIINKGNLSLEI